MGKYAAFRGKYPDAPVDQKWGAKVNTVREEELRDKPIHELGERYDKLRLEMDKIDERLSDLNIMKAALEQEIFDKLVDAGMEKVKLASGTSLSLKDTPYSAEENRPEFIKFIKENGLTGMFSVHYQRLNSLVCERLMKGQPTPPGIKVFMKKSLNWRNPNRKKREGEDENGED